MTRRVTTRCGNASPPADGTPEREIIDRFADFLRVAGPALSPQQVADGGFRLRSPAERYHLRFLAWRIGQVQR